MEEKPISNQIENEDNSDVDDDFHRLNLPKKSQYRMRAHCNPLAEVTIP
jgi:hypothetical protein